jgi:HD-GYP domain-containing protein (c-di-GMP phosphodiesterase class II)
LAEVVGSIAMATDLGLGMPLEHVLRSTVIGVRFAEALGASAEDVDATYWSTLFFGAGCIGTSYELSALFGDDIAFRRDAFDVGERNLDRLRYVVGRAGSDRSGFGRWWAKASLALGGLSSFMQTFLAHCAVSAQMADRVGLGDRVVTCLLQSFEQTNGKGMPLGLKGDEVLLPIQIANLAGAVEIPDREKGWEASVAFARDNVGYLDAGLVGRWCELAEGVLDGVDAESSWDRVVGHQSLGSRTLTQAELDEALELLADFADLKSPWFTGHSRAVASLAMAAGRELGLPDADLVTLRRSALLHDIGRVGVPNSLWDKRGPLTAAEAEKVRLHAYYTDRVLHRSGKLAFLASVASAAHERADGSGYPRGTSGATSPVLARLIAAADCYHAMLEDRPHRESLGRAAAAAELRRAARDGKLDAAAVDAVLAADGHRVRKKPAAPAGLTVREVEVLVLAARGRTTKAIADTLGVAPKTAGNHIERIYEKTGLRSRAEVAMFAMRNGLLPDWETET